MRLIRNKRIKGLEHGLRNALEPSAIDPVAIASVVIRSMRYWREACDARFPVQPHLSGMLAVRACAVLAPVLDSLFCFYETALGRPLTVGDTGSPSADELLLLQLMEQPDLCGRTMGCAAGALLGLNCALCSARVMLALALQGTIHQEAASGNVMVN